MKSFRYLFGENGAAQPLLGIGWGQPEKGFNWSLGQRSYLSLPLQTGSGDLEIELHVAPHVNPPRLARQELTVVINGASLATRSLTGGREVVRVHVPEQLLTGASSQTVTFEHPFALAPKDLENSTDTRPLAVAFFEIGVAQHSSTADVDDDEADLVPPASLLFDGAATPEAFRSLGEGFTRVNLIERGHLQRHERVLDIGSGNGQKSRVLSRYLSARGSYEGLDVVADGVSWCQRAYARFANFRFQLADIYSSQYNPGASTRAENYRLPYSDGEFDLVFLCSVFTHMSGPEVTNYIKEISRVLKPRGRCVATFFLLTPEAMTRIKEGKSKFDFSHTAPNGRIIDSANPSLAAAFYEVWVRSQFSAASLDVCEITYGTWSGMRDLLGALQDVVIAVKP
jgi:SAM-dependent methyltransferase